MDLRSEHQKRISEAMRMWWRRKRKRVAGQMVAAWQAAPEGLEASAGSPRSVPLESFPRADCEGRMSRMQRDKGQRMEREIVQLHRDLGLKAERVPLSGATAYQGNGADVDVYVFGSDAAPLVTEVKARASGKGFATLARWLGENDALFLRQDRAEPIVALPWRTWARLVKKW